MIRKALIAAVASILAGMVFAHSKMDLTDPADGAVLEAAPEHITLRFDAAIRLTRVEMVQVGREATSLDLSSVQTFETEFVLPVPAMDAGRYEIRWRGLGEDGHPMKGQFSFDVK